MVLDIFSSYITDVFSNVIYSPPTLDVILAAILAAILLLISGFASGSEIAFFSLGPSDIANLDLEKNEIDKKIQLLRDDSERTLATILITNNLVNVTIIMLCNYIFDKILDFGNNTWLEFLFLTVILTFLLLLFGEIMPKIYSRQISLKFCRKAVNGIMFLRNMFWPFESILLKSGILAKKMEGNKSHTLSIDDLEQALNLTNKKEIKDEQSMLQGIIRFGDETAKDVMTTRQDIVDLDIQSSFSDVLNSIVANNFSRIPVYQGNADNIRGVLYIKDLLPYLNKSSNFHWQSLIRPPHFVPETKRLDDLMSDFQQNKFHIAIVVDEFGGTSGIVTLEDILEEIVGEINDEYDDGKKNYTKIGDNTYIFEGKTLLSDFCKITEVDSDEFAEIEGDADSLAGLLLEIKSDFPKKNERLKFKNFTFKILEIEDRRISKIEVIIHDHNSNLLK